MDTASLNAAGHTIFRAILAGAGVDLTNDSGIWSEGTGTLTLLAREGDQAPGALAGVDFDFFNNLLINDSGQAAILASLVGTGVDNTNNIGIWSQGTGTLALVARTGSHAPGTPAGVVFSFFDSSGLLLNNAGQTAFRGILTGPGVDATNDRGIWSERPGTVALVARTGDQAPGTPIGVQFLIFLTAPVLNNAGLTAFSGALTGPGVSTLNNTGIWSEGTGSLAILARAGDPAPGTPAGVNFDVLLNAPLAINDAGHTAFRGTLVGPGVDGSNNIAVWSQGSGSLALVARAGDPAPGAATFSGFGPPVLNGSGRTAFAATLTGIGVAPTNDSGIWSEGAGTLALVARTGDPAPGTPPGVTFNSLTDPVLNAAGSTAFLAGLSGAGVGGSNDSGLWAQTGDGTLTLIARHGDAMEVAPGDSRIISSLTLLGDSGGQDGRPRSLNDAGQVAFSVGFTDGTSAVCVATTCIAADVNGDSVVNLSDVGAFVGVLLAPSSASAAQSCAADLNGDSSLDGEDVTPFLEQLLP